MSNGFLREVRGALPLSLTHSLAKECGLTVYGNTQKILTIDNIKYRDIPDDVTLVESVTANKSGFVLDFGITPKLNTKARVVFIPLARNNSGYFGARKDSDNVRFSITTFSTGSQFSFAFTQSTWSNNKTSLVIGRRYDCTAYNGKQVINGTEYNETVLSDLRSTAATFKICAPDQGGEPAAEATLNAIYEIVNIWEGETPVLLAHPAIRNNVVGYYDFVSKSFIAPTSGTLTAGKMTRTENFHTDIPSELYEECEYLGLQGDEYIDTNINPSNKIIGAVIDFQCTDTASSVGGIFGSNKTDGTDNCQFTVYQSKWRTKINNFAHYGANYDTNRHTVRFNMPDGTKLDNTVITNTQYTIASGNNVSLLLGACSYNGSPISTNIKYTLIGKLYPSKIYVDGVLARDYVSVKRLSDDQYGMYDRVTSTFKPNEGTGAFTGGPSRQIEVPICEYEFVGDAYGNMYDVPLRMTGVNLFDSSDMTLGEVINENGSTSSSSITNHSNYIAVMPNTTYVVKDRSKFKDGVNQITRYHAYGSDKTWLSQMVLLTVTQTDTDFDVTFTTPANCYYVRFTTRQPLNNAVIMMAKGSTAPASYHPYVSPVLRHLASSRKLGKIGSIADTASIKDNVRTSVFRMGHKVFDGTEDWTWQAQDSRIVCSINAKSGEILNIKCSHYLAALTYQAASGVNLSNSGDILYLKDTDNITDLATGKAFLAKQYAAGHPVEIWYPLATAVTETATETNVTLPENDVTLDAESTVKPSEGAVIFNSRSNY